MEEKDGTEVRVDHRFEVAPVGIDELAHVAAVGVARVVYHHVEAPKLADRVIEDLPDVVHVTQVEAHGNGPPARGLDLLSGLPDRARPVIHRTLRHGPRRNDDREPSRPSSIEIPLPTPRLAPVTNATFDSFAITSLPNRIAPEAPML